MNVLFVSPLRVRPTDWPRFSRLISTSFDKGQLPEGFGAAWNFEVGKDFKYHPITGAAATPDGAITDTMETGLAAALGRVRRSGCATQVLHPGALLVVWDTGDAVVIEAHKIEGDFDDILRGIKTAREAASAAVRNAANRLAPVLEAIGAAFQAGETITHTILVTDPESAVTEDVAGHCFGVEGLDLAEMRRANASGHLTGWSYSVFRGPASHRFWDAVGVVARSQCEWYTVRVARRYCLGTLANSDLRRSVSDLIARERQIVRFQTELRLWHHRMGEYRENLKPELTEQSRAIEAMWDVEGGLGYVLNTLTQSRDLIETSYSRRILLQERRQSQMLFFLTILGVLSLASISASYWNWLTLAAITADADVATPAGRALVSVGLGALLVVLAGLVAIYIRIRRRPD